MGSNHDRDAEQGVLAQVVRQGRRRDDRRLLPSPARGVAGKAQAADRPVREPRPGRPERRRLVHHDPRRQHGVAQVRPHRARPGLDDRPADDRRRGARHGREPARTSRSTPATRTSTPNTGNTGGSTSISQGGPLRPPRRGGGEGRRCSRMAATNLGVPVASLTVEQGRRLRRRQDRHLRPAHRRQAVQRHVHDDDAERRRVAPAKPVAQYKTRRQAPASPRDDIPAMVNGTHTYVRNVRVPGHAARPDRPAARPGRVRRRHEPGRRRRSTRARSSTSRTSRSSHVGNVLGVVAPKEYDAIQAAAQLKVQWSDPPAISGSGNLWKWMREQDAAGKAPARIATQTAGNIDAALEVGREDVLAERSPTTTRCTLRSARTSPIADVTKDSAIVYTHVKNGYGNTRPQIAAALSTASGRTYDTIRVRVIYYEGASSFGGGAQHVDVGEAAAILSHGSGRAGPAPAHALGRARLGQLQPGHDVGRRRRRRRERQDRRVRRHELRHGLLQQDARPSRRSASRW